MKKITVLIISVLLLGSYIAQAQNAKELFKSEFPELINTNFDDSDSIDSETIAKYRAQYNKLKETSKQLKTYKFGGATDENMTIFEFKELKSLEKDQQIEPLQNIVQDNLKGIRHYLSDKTKYGADSIECIEQSSILKTLVDSEDYKNAYQPWKMLFNCYPVSSKNIYLWGEDIIEFKIKNTLTQAKDTQSAAKEIIKNAEPLKESDIPKYNAEIEKANAKLNAVKEILVQRDRWVDTLLLLYDQRIKYYGDDSKQYGEGYLIGQKGIALYKYQRRERLEEAYKFLKQSAQMQAEYPSLATLQYYFFAADELYEKEALDAETVVEDYTLCQDILSAFIEKLETLAEQRPDKKSSYEKAISSAQTVADNLTDKFSLGEYAKCSVLVPAFDSKFEEKKDDIQWLKKTISILASRKGEGSEECMKSEFFENATTRLYELEPSANAAKNLAEFYLKKEDPDFENAAKYYKEAYTLETDSMQKAEYYYNAAVVASAQGQLSKSRTLAQNALDLSPEMGKAYILIGKLYIKGLGSCGEDSFEKSMVYWVAADMMIKAKSTDSSVSEEANSLINAYSSKFPRKEEAFMRGIKPGDSVSIGCWIQRSTTARFIQ